MQIIDRAAAKAAALNKYFTGKECANGHIAERYTQSGACYLCIKASVDAARAGHVSQAAAYRTLGDLAEAVQVVYVRLPLSTLESVRSVAAALLRARFPDVAAEALSCAPASSQIAAGTAVVRILAHRDDELMIRTIANAECLRFGGGA